MSKGYIIKINILEKNLFMVLVKTKYHYCIAYSNINTLYTTWKIRKIKKFEKIGKLFIYFIYLNNAADSYEAARLC